MFACISTLEKESRNSYGRSFNAVELCLGLFSLKLLIPETRQP